ncbi:cyclopropane-fatty-acyl-phospholipid synthase family protein [Lacisediminimonas sp.]|uniref:SAM-dependent methyltransferase n=1 Tax=Lacisediminimonas sp. TaxID=3060582 RepID=UPI002721CDF8|nr:class I SAM-dependent methyltransferase [Lacisediminimonas sp.]MDO8298865.1 class I SAM-dependent methyltransferase [Lacisediminimonas sp.]
MTHIRHHHRPTNMAATLTAAIFSFTGSSRAQHASQLDVPYVPTPMLVVNKMLDLANVGKNDVLYDLGCGDGRSVITAASKRGARGIGIDLDPDRISEAQANAKKARVQDRVQFVVGDLFETDFSKASVVTLYLLPQVNEKLRPQLWRQLKVGSRVVSHGCDMGSEWPPDKVEQVDGKTIYYWTIKPTHKKARLATAEAAQSSGGDVPA